MEQREAIELLVNQLREELSKESVKLYLALIDYKERYF